MNTKPIEGNTYYVSGKRVIVILAEYPSVRPQLLGQAGYPGQDKKCKVRVVETGEEYDVDFDDLSETPS